MTRYCLSFSVTLLATALFVGVLAAQPDSLKNKLTPDGVTPILSDEEALRIQLKGSVYDLNKVEVSPYSQLRAKPEEFQKYLGFITYEALKGETIEARRWASLEVVDTILMLAYTQKIKDHDDLMKAFPESWVRDNLYAPLENQDRDGLPRLSDILEGPGTKKISDFSNKWWEDTSVRNLLLIALYKVRANLTDDIEKRVTARAAQKLLLNDNAFKRWCGRELRQGNTDPTFLFRVEYLGETPLTNVIFVRSIQTTGASAMLTEQQVQGISLLEGAGLLVGEQAQRTRARTSRVVLGTMTTNVLETMPRKGYTYVPVLRKGDVIEMPMVSNTRLPEVATSATLLGYCDQGLIPVRTAQFKPAKP